MTGCWGWKGESCDEGEYPKLVGGEVPKEFTIIELAGETEYPTCGYGVTITGLEGGESA